MSLKYTLKNETVMEMQMTTKLKHENKNRLCNWSQFVNKNENGYGNKNENGNQNKFSKKTTPKRVGTGTGTQSQEKINILHEGINNTHHHQQTQRHKMNL